MFDLIFNQDDFFFFEKNERPLVDHNKKLTSNSDLQFHDNGQIAKCQTVATLTLAPV